jgi:hypothetical protein
MDRVTWCLSKDVTKVEEATRSRVKVARQCVVVENYYDRDGANLKHDC